MDKELFLVDIEQQENAAAIGIIGLEEEQEAAAFMAAGKEIIPLAKPGSALSDLLERVCGLYSCDDRGPKDFPFYPVPRLCLFGEDEYGTVYGLIGELHEERAVGFVTKEGRTGRSAESLPDFLLFTALCPGWQRAVAEDAPLPPCPADLSPEQQRLLTLLGLSPDPAVSARAEQCRREDAGFTIYASREEAGKDWHFL